MEQLKLSQQNKLLLRHEEHENEKHENNRSLTTSARGLRQSIFGLSLMLEGNLGNFFKFSTCFIPPQTSAYKMTTESIKNNENIITIHGRLGITFMLLNKSFLEANWNENYNNKLDEREMFEWKTKTVKIFPFNEFTFLTNYRHQSYVSASPSPSHTAFLFHLISTTFIHWLFDAVHDVFIDFPPNLFSRNDWLDEFPTR